jgi:hypothetical protein
MLQLPALHSNGSSKQSLLDDVLDSRDALNKASALIARFGPHMRDYYPLPDGNAAYAKAKAEHESRLTRIKSIIDELTELADGIDNGGAYAQAERLRIVAAVREHAKHHANYQTGANGWDILIEAWEDSDILRAILEANAMTAQAAIEAIGPRLKAAADYRREIEATAF